MFRPNCARLVVMFVPAIGGQLPHPLLGEFAIRLGLSRRHEDIAGLVTIAKPTKASLNDINVSLANVGFVYHINSVLFDVLWFIVAKRS